MKHLQIIVLTSLLLLPAIVFTQVNIWSSPGVKTDADGRTQQSNLRHFPDPNRTSLNMSILFVSITGIEVVDGAELACFTPDGILAGAISISIEDTSWGLAAWGDETRTEEVVEGFVDGEAIHLLYWDPVHDWELEMSVEFIDGDSLIWHLNDFIVIEATLGIDNDEPKNPSQFDLIGVFPNPFNSFARIDFELPFRNRVSLNIYDLAGRKVMNLFEERLEVGRYSRLLDGKNLHSGLYFVMLESAGQRNIKRVVLIK